MRGLQPPCPPVPNFYLLFGVIAVAAAILWASRQGRPSETSTPKDSRRPADARPAHPMAWIVFAVMGAVLLAAGVVLGFSPGEPSGGGGKGGALLAYAAYWLLGDYGPAITLLAMGAACLHQAYRLLRGD